MITKENYITASFIDNERKNIEVIVRDDENKKLIPHIIQYDTNHPSCQELLKIITLDDLHENTHNKVNEQKKDFEEMVMRVAKKKGIIVDPEMVKVTPKLFKTLVQTIFKDSENEDHLFALKLALFEVVEIRDSKNNELKKELRQGKNKIEVLKAAFDIMNG
tara:strand:+ start:43 stop:528 length:486 start_codon:yes stop_codon:yes gene_type:complete